VSEYRTHTTYKDTQGTMLLARNETIVPNDGDFVRINDVTYKVAHVSRYAGSATVTLERA
jgi:hypothetical protein